MRALAPAECFLFSQCSEIMKIWVPCVWQGSDGDLLIPAQRCELIGDWAHFGRKVMSIYNLPLAWSCSAPPGFDWLIIMVSTSLTALLFTCESAVMQHKLYGSLNSLCSQRCNNCKGAIFLHIELLSGKIPTCRNKWQEDIWGFNLLANASLVFSSSRKMVLWGWSRCHLCCWGEK